MKMMLVFVVVIFSCAGSKKSVSSPVNIVTLNNYILNNKANPVDSVQYFFITDKSVFDHTFSLTKSGPGSIKVPDFSIESVVAIILPSTSKVIAVEISAADKENKTLNISYNIIDTTSWRTYPHTPAAIAIVPKDGALQMVSFVRNEVKDKTILVTK